MTRAGLPGPAPCWPGAQPGELPARSLPPPATLQVARSLRPSCFGPVSRPGFLNVTHRHRGAGDVCPHQAPTLCPLVSNSRGTFSCGDCSRVVTSPILRRHLQVFLDSASRPRCTIRVKVGAARGWCLRVHLQGPFTCRQAGAASPGLFLGREGSSLCGGAGGLEPHVSPREGYFR